MKLGEKIRLLLVDDHAVVRSGLGVLLSGRDEMEVVGEAADGEEAVARALQLKPDVVLMDLSMPLMGGLEAIRQLRKKLPGTRVLVLTMHEDERYLSEALNAGAAGYVPKKAADTELVSAIKAVNRGEPYLYPSVARTVLDAYLKRESPTGGADAADVYREPLTDREREVLRLVAMGYTNQEIADEMAVSTKTVETHKARIMGKLHMRRRSELVRYALEKGLVSLDR